MGLKRVFLLGILGGAFVSVGYTAALILMSAGVGHISPAGLKILSALVFPLGIILVLFVGADLFTGNVLSGLALLNKKLTILEVFSNLIVVWFGNFIGAIVTAYLIYSTGIADINLKMLVLNTVDYKLHLSNIQVIISGFFCNLIVALSIWATLSAKDAVGKFLLIYFPIFVFVICGFQHCVANMFLFSYGVFLGGDFNLLVILNSVLMATIGNYLSGGLIFPLFYKYLHLKD